MYISKFLILFLIPFVLFSNEKQERETLQKSLSLYEKKQYIPSIRLLKDIQNYQSYYLLAHNYIRLKKWWKAIFYLKEIWKIKPSKRNLIVIELAKCYFNVKRYYKSLQIVRNAKKDFLNLEELGFLEIINLIYVNKLKEALKKIEKLKSDNKISLRLLALESKIYFKIQQYEKASLSLRWALSLNKKNSNLLNNLAIIYENQALQLLKKKKYKESYNLLITAKTNFEDAIKYQNKENSNLIKQNYNRILKRIINVSSKI